MFFPFITGKNFIFRIIVELIVGAWIILAVRDRSYRPQKSFLLWAFVAFVALIGVSNVLGPNPTKSFWSNFERMEGWVTLVHLLGLFLVSSSVLKTQKLWDRFFYSSIGVSVVVGIYGLLQLAGSIEIHQGGVRLDATFGNATYLAIYMLFHLFILAFFAARRFTEKGHTIKTMWGDWALYLLGLIGLLQFIILFNTATRGAILGLVGGVLLTYILIGLFEKKYISLRKIALLKLVIVLLIVGAFFALKGTSFIKNSLTLGRIADISLEETTTLSRFLVWDMAWKGFKEKPIFGWGQENFNYVFNENYNPKMYNQEQWFDRAHNVFFDWLVAGGLLGLLSYLALFGGALYMLWRKVDGLSVSEKAIFTGLFAGYFFHNLFVFDNITSYLLFVSVLAFIQSQKRHSLVKGGEDQIPQTVFSNTIVSLVIILSIFSVYFFNVKGISQARALIGAIASPTPEENLANFDEALKRSVMGRQEVVEQLAQAASNAAVSNIDINLKQQFFDKAQVALDEFTRVDSENARMELFYGVVLNRYRFYDEAIQHINQALELSPKKQTIMFELASAYLGSGDTESAFNVLKEAFELAPEYERSRILYAMSAIYSGKEELLEDILVPLYGTTLVPDPQIIQAHTAHGNYEAALSLWDIRIEQEPENVQNILGRASVLIELGRRTEAVLEIRKVIELQPSFQAQGEYYIQEIEAGRNP